MRTGDYHIMGAKKVNSVKLSSGFLMLEETSNGFVIRDKI